MTDLHCHILPGLDDGSAGREHSKKMLEAARKEGVTRLCATSHASPSAEEHYEEAFLWLRQEAAGLGVEVLPGMEYDYDRLAACDLSRLRTLGGSRALLVDLKESVLPPSVPELFYELEKHEFQIVIVHPERLFYRDPDALLAALEPYDPAYLVNAGSLLGRHGPAVRQTAWHLLDEGFCHAIASDAHRSKHYRFQALKLLLLRYYPERCVKRWLEENPARLLADEPVEAPHPPKLNWFRRWKRKREAALS